MRKKKTKDDEQLIAFRKQNVSLYKPVTSNELNCCCFCHIINILLTELSRFAWENLVFGRVYRPHCVRSVLTISIKILPYRPPARLIRAKFGPKKLVQQDFYKFFNKQSLPNWPGCSSSIGMKMKHSRQLDESHCEIPPTWDCSQNIKK